MRTSHDGDPTRLIAQLRQRAGRHRRLAEALTSAHDRRIALHEAKQAEAEAGRIEAELSGALTAALIAAPLHEQVGRQLLAGSVVQPSAPIPIGPAD